jgi:branched-chain amino acid transport system ATP-binding protein
VLDISKGGVPLIVVEQDVEFLLELSQHLYLVNHGQVATEIKPGQSMDHGEIMRMYFGH